ncbi:unnamed protein product [Lactuca saligna]|uniref:RRM domain-containing protein n=1 Tax=Lactuca saligna TaxID=75948 RepID=A0AA35VC53_LACSI|nr:unnamed protein product [Lactuca saligna]
MRTLNMEDGWTEVRRRKTVATSNGNTTEVTTFFITNIPNDTTKAEFGKIFSQMGRLSDICFGSNKRKNGKNYGFIRNNKLEINVARHGRKTRPLSPDKINKNSRIVAPPGQNTNINGGGLTYHKTYAQMLTWIDGSQNPPSSAKLNIWITLVTCQLSYPSTANAALQSNTLEGCLH